MNGSYLLDTNIVIALFAGEQSLLNHLSNAAEIYIPSIVIGELYYGARKSNQVEENLLRIADFISRNSIVSCDTATAFHYGYIKDRLRQKGKPIPENDLWIASMAIQYEHILVSRDDHFLWIQDLSLEHW